ncbi:isoprenylcysteine carboxylmethyltransferase family protein [Actinomadura harenae]|uniref:Isoprenylcysteine carboxylmethyltransferase family protein n=2 Tax=Actinomadura harenae TaxID=2483351 RepID=A0A3M2LU34_9ACTN|nr:isoprenylcysteine carboxylmethyltransferase family protein [Actinomadura harenae]
MKDMGVWFFYAALIVWLAGEVGLRVVEMRKAGTVRVSEHGTLGLFVVLGVGGTVVGAAVGRAVPSLDWHVGSAVYLVAAAVMLAGLVIRFWAIVTLGKFFRSSVHVQEGHEVVSDGPYRFVRHPSYTGLMLLFIGASLTFGNALAVVIFLVCVSIATLVRIRVEERVLSAELGEAYREFARTRARLVPYVW